MGFPTNYMVYLAFKPGYLPGGRMQFGGPGGYSMVHWPHS